MIRLGVGDAPVAQPYAGAYDSVRHEFVLTGFGAAAFGGAGWRQIFGFGSPEYSQLVFDSARDRFVRYFEIVGGGGGGGMSLAEWDGTGWTALPTNGPSPRGGARPCRPSSVPRVDHHRFGKILGGRLGGVLSDEELRIELWPFIPLVVVPRPEYAFEAGTASLT